MTETESKNPSILVQIRNFFGFTRASEFMAEWKALTPEDQKQIKFGFENGSMTY